MSSRSRKPSRKSNGRKATSNRSSASLLAELKRATRTLKRPSRGIGGGRRRPGNTPRTRGNTRSGLNRAGRVQTMGSAAPAAVSIKGMKVGMSDIKSHIVSWLTGYIYVGNGTLGAINSIYFVDPTQTYTLLNNIPVVGDDTLIGATYISDIEKHFARKIIRNQRLTLLPLFPSTSNSMTVIVAPERGPTGAFEVVTKTNTTAANLYTNVLSMNGAKQCSSWEQMDIDLTPYIAGGSGAKQNEFSIDSLQNADGVNSTGQFPAALGVIPTTFCVSGNNSTVALQGTVTHAVVISQSIDLIDFIGGQVDPKPEEINIRMESSRYINQSIHRQESKDYLGEFHKFVEFMKHSDLKQPSAETKQQLVENNDGLAFKEENAYFHVPNMLNIDLPTTIIDNGKVKINPLINDESYDNFPKSESFINSVKELINKRSSK